MAIFGGSSSKTEVKSSSVGSNSKSTTIITDCMNIKGDIDGCGAIHIDGTMHGNINVAETVIIGSSGSVHGNIKSNRVVISGKLEGSVSCTSLEVTQTGTVSDKITAKDIVADGVIEATLVADDTIKVTANGNITTDHLQGKHVVVNGHIDGNIIASELLEINKDGEVRGKMTVKKIKVSEGGLMLGTMLSYDSTSNNQQVETSTKAPEAKKETKEK